MNTLNYKGYIGSIEVSETDNCLYGKVLALPTGTLITYEGETVAELRADFEGAIDDYLAMCEAEGIAPKRSYSGALNIRISPEVHSRIATQAMLEGVTINAYIKRVLSAQVGVI